MMDSIDSWLALASSNTPPTNCPRASVTGTLCSDLKDAYIRGDNSHLWPAAATLQQPMYFSEGFYGQWGDGYIAPPRSDLTWPATQVFAPGCTLDCGGCAVTGGTIELLYFPPGLAHAATATASLEISTLGTVLTSPTQYISFRSVYASDACSGVGTTISSTIIAIPPSLTLSSIWAIPRMLENPYAAMAMAPPWLFTSTASYNIIDLLQTPVPYEIYASQPVCAQEIFFNQGGNDSPCITNNPYQPIVVLPATVLQSLQPAWASCSADLRGYFDPPKSLIPTDSIAGPSLTAAQMMTTTVVPASPSPTLSSPSAPRTTQAAVDPATSTGSEASLPSATAVDPTSAAGPARTFAATDAPIDPSATSVVPSPDSQGASSAVPSPDDEAASSAAPAQPDGQSPAFDPGDASSVPVNGDPVTSGLNLGSPTTSAIVSAQPATQNPAPQDDGPETAANTGTGIAAAIMSAIGGIPSEVTSKSAPDGGTGLVAAINSVADGIANPLNDPIATVASLSTPEAINAAGSPGAPSAFSVSGNPKAAVSAVVVVDPNGQTLTVAQEGGSTLGIENTIVTDASGQPISFSRSGSIIIAEASGTTASLPSGSVAVINGKTISALYSSGIVVVDGSSIYLPSSTLSSEGAVITEADGQLISFQQSGSVILAAAPTTTATLSSDGTAVIDGQTISAIYSDGVVVVDGSSIHLPDSASPVGPVVTDANGRPLSFQRSGSVILAEDATTTVALSGDATAVIDGHTIGALPSSGIVVVDGSTIRLPDSASPVVTDAHGQPISFQRSGSVILAEAPTTTATLSDDGVAVIDGQTISALPSSGIVVVDGSTIRLPDSASPVGPVVTDANGRPISFQRSGSVILAEDATTTVALSGDATAVIDGQTISAINSNRIVVIDGSSISLSDPLTSTVSSSPSMQTTGPSGSGATQSSGTASGTSTTKATSTGVNLLDAQRYTLFVYGLVLGLLMVLR